MDAPTRDTIFALSSGALPAGIGVVRVSGPNAAQALEKLAGILPEACRAMSATLRWQGDMLDRALILLYLEGYAQDEIAALVGLSATNVATRISRIRQKLQRAYAAAEESA